MSALFVAIEPSYSEEEDEDEEDEDDEDDELRCFEF